MQTMFTPNIIPLNALSQAKLLRNDWRKVLPTIMDEIKRKFTFFR